MKLSVLDVAKVNYFLSLCLLLVTAMIESLAYTPISPLLRG